MERREHTVKPAEAGHTILRILHDHCGFSHSAARGVVAAGRVLRNGQPATRPAERVQPGDRVQIEFDPARRYHEPKHARREDGFRVVFEDERMVVVDKAPGLLTVAAPGDEEGSVEDRLAAAYRRRGFRRPFVRAVHRIDRQTSGLVAFARSEVAWKALREQFSARTPERVYLAAVEGRLDDQRGELRHRLDEHPDSLKVRAVSGRRGKDASSAYRVVERFPAATLVEVRLLTGRRNQIRVQFAAEGHPLVGDLTYGHPSPLIGRCALHAWRLAFDDPHDASRRQFVSEPPEDFRTLTRRLKKGAQPAGRNPGTYSIDSRDPRRHPGAGRGQAAQPRDRRPAPAPQRDRSRSAASPSDRSQAPAPPRGRREPPAPKRDRREAAPPLRDARAGRTRARSGRGQATTAAARRGSKKKS